MADHARFVRVQLPENQMWDQAPLIRRAQAIVQAALEQGVALREFKHLTFAETDKKGDVMPNGRTGHVAMLEFVSEVKASWFT